MKSKFLFTILSVLALLVLVFPVDPVMASKPVPPAQTQLPGTKIAQFVDPLSMLTVAGGGFETVVAGTNEINLNMLEVQTKMMPSTFVPANGLPYTGTWNFSYRVGPTTAPTTAACSSLLEGLSIMIFSLSHTAETISPAFIFTTAVCLVITCANAWPVLSP
jgi:hypothetical protein